MDIFIKSVFFASYLQYISSHLPVVFVTSCGVFAATAAAA